MFISDLTTLVSLILLKSMTKLNGLPEMRLSRTEVAFLTITESERLENVSQIRFFPHLIKVC